MKSLRLLLVDDEITTIRFIQKRIDWAALGIGEIRTAQDGMEALEQCSSWQPDILLSDVRMPRMDGIKLAEILRERCPSIHIIFISGYTDKQYLKSAIYLKAINYIEKPINWEECREALSEACKDIRSRDRQEEALSAYQDEHRRQLQNSLSLGLSASRYDHESAEAMVTELFPDFGKFSYCVALQLQFYREEERSPSVLTECFSFLYEEAEKLSLDCCAAAKHGYLVIFLFSRISHPGSTGYHTISDYSAALVRKLTLRDAHFTLGIGRLVKKWEDLPSSWEDACQASSQAFYHQLGSVIYFQSFATRIYDFSSRDPLELVRGIRKLPKEQFVFTLRSLVSDLHQHERTPPDQVRKYFSSLMLELRRLAEADSSPVWPELSSDHELVRRILSEPFLDGLLALLLEGVEQYYHFLETDVYPNATVNWIIRHIRQNYADPDLSVTTISLATNLSATYICHLFKDVTGNTLHNYITEYRMQKAAQLICDPLNRVSDVAELVGYRNGNYFSYRFRKSFGLSPSEYKENHG